MSRDDARKLLGGYATGSLTEAERTALFQAALEDQDLFDELAGEQALKEVLDVPGARQRLIAVLEPPRRHRAWLWAIAGATVAIAVVIGIVVSQRTPPPPQQIAQVLKSPEPVVVIPAPPPAPVSPKPKVASPASLPGPPPPPELKKEATTLAEQADQVQAPKPQAAAGAVRQFAAARVASTFAFTYMVNGDGFLEVTPAVTGFLSITAGNAVVFASTLVGVNTLRIAIPSDATTLTIAFSKTQDITGTPVRRDETSGSVADQDPPNGRIIVQIPATR